MNAFLGLFGRCSDPSEKTERMPLQGADEIIAGLGADGRARSFAFWQFGP
jgi:hypothetical protein